MQVTVIGCWGGYPAPNGATAAYIVEKDGFVLLVDCGSGALSKVQNYVDVQDIDAVIISHYHHDHIADIGVLQYARLVDYYISNQTTILPIYGHQEDKDGFDDLSSNFTQGIVYNPNEALKIGPFTICFLKTQHPVSCYGMKITDGYKTFVYTADTAYDDAWIEFSQGADMMIADCNFYAEQDGEASGHMTSQESAFIAEQAKIKTLILSHLPTYGNIQQLVVEAENVYSGNIQLAHEGLRWRGERST